MFFSLIKRSLLNSPWAKDCIFLEMFSGFCKYAKCHPPSGIILDDGVYYNKYMPGNKIKMSKPLMEGAVEYRDGTETSEEQMSKDVVAFLAWAAEPHLEARHKMGFKAIVYLIILTILVYFSMKKIWSRIETEV